MAGRLEFFAAADGVVRVRHYDTSEGFNWQVNLTAGHWAALDTAMDTPGTSYVVTDTEKNAGALNPNDETA